MINDLNSTLHEFSTTIAWVSGQNDALESSFLSLVLWCALKQARGVSELQVTHWNLLSAFFPSEAS